jgi:hypothetical protein
MLWASSWGQVCTLTGGPDLDGLLGVCKQLGGAVDHRFGTCERLSEQSDRRRSARKPMSLPGHLVWRDERGAMRFASVVTRDVGDHGVLLECLSGPAVPLFRLAHLQLESSVRRHPEVPAPLQADKVLSAVYRVTPAGTADRTGCTYALRLLVDSPQLPAKNLRLAKGFAAGSERTALAAPGPASI